MSPQILTSLGGIPVYVFDLSDAPCALRAHQWSPTSRRDPASAKGILLLRTDPIPPTAADKARGGLIAAIAARGLSRPAHIAVGMAKDIPVVSICHPLDRYTFMGGETGNYVGVEIHAKLPGEASGRNPVIHTPLTPALGGGIEVALSVAMQLLSSWSTQETQEMLTARQATGTMDPGEDVVALALEGLPFQLQADPDHVLSTGEPWPPSWRSHLSHEA